MSDGIYSNGSHVNWTGSGGSFTYADSTNAFIVESDGDTVTSWGRPPPTPFFDVERPDKVISTGFPKLPRVKIDHYHRTVNAILVGDFTRVTHHLYRDENRNGRKYRVLSAPMNIETDTTSYSAKLTDVNGSWNGWLVLNEEGDVLTEGTFDLPIVGMGSDVALNFEAPRIN